MKSKVIVITGATDRVGAAAARRLACDGHHVVLVGRSADKTAALAQELATDYFIADFTRLSNVRTLADCLLAKVPSNRRAREQRGRRVGSRASYLAGRARDDVPGELPCRVLAHHAAHRSSDQVARDGDLQFRLRQQIRDHRPLRSSRRGALQRDQGVLQQPARTDPVRARAVPAIRTRTRHRHRSVSPWQHRDRIISARRLRRFAGSITCRPDIHGQ